MNISYEWKITNIIKKDVLDGLENVLLRIVYEYKGIDADSGEEYTMLGGLDLNPPSSNNFTPITELKKEQVIGWLDNHIETPKLQKNIQNCIQSQINMNGVKTADEIDWLETIVPEEIVHQEPPISTTEKTN